jgi:hypothetical protein
MSDRELNGVTMSDNVCNGKDGNLEERFEENCLRLKFSENGWKKRIDAAMSASNQELDFVIEFIERKGNFMDYIH